MVRRRYLMMYIRHYHRQHAVYNDWWYIQQQSSIIHGYCIAMACIFRYIVAMLYHRRRRLATGYGEDCARDRRQVKDDVGPTRRYARRPRLRKRDCRLSPVAVAMSDDSNDYFLEFYHHPPYTKLLPTLRGVTV